MYGQRTGTERETHRERERRERIGGNKKQKVYSCNGWTEKIERQSRERWRETEKTQSVSLFQFFFFSTYFSKAFVIEGARVLCPLLVPILSTVGVIAEE